MGHLNICLLADTDARQRLTVTVDNNGTAARPLT